MRPEDLGTVSPLAQTASGGAAERPIVLAQATTAPAGTPPAPAAAPQPMPLPPAEQVTRLKPLPFGGGIEATAYALPNAATFDRIRVVEVDGRLVLALVQPDGSVIVLEGTEPVQGSTTEFEVPNLIVGDVEVPREAIQAAFLGNGIVPAAGEPVSPSSGFNGDEPFPGIGDGLGISPLLPPTDLGFPQFDPRDLADDVDLGLDGLIGALAIDLVPPGDDGLPPDGSLVPPRFVSGVIGAGDGPGNPGGEGPGEEGPGNPGSGPNQANGFMRLDQSAIEGGNRVNAGGVSTLTNEVVIQAGTNEARLVFGALDSLVTQTNGTGPADLIWRNDPEAPQTRILGYVDRNADGVPDAGELAVVIELSGTPARPEQSSAYTVTVTLLQGLPDPVPGPGEGGRDTDGFDLGSIPLVIVDGIFTVPGEIDLVVLDDVPVLTEGSTGPLIVDEDALSGGNIDTGTPGENNRPDPVSTVTGSLAGLVSVGSDAVTPGSSTPLFSLKPFEGAGPHVLAGVTSQGAPILLAISGTTLTGYVEANASDGYQGGVGADRAVFTLTLSPDGGFTFTLLDQVDHPTLNGLAGDNTENAAPLVLDLSSYVIAQDSDADTVTLAPGMLAVQVLDDIPVAVTASTMVFTSVFEDSGYFNVLEVRDANGTTIPVAESPGSTANVLMNSDSTATGNFRLNTGHDSTLARVQIWADNGDGVFDRSTDVMVGDERLVSALTWNDLAAASADGTRDLFLAFDDDGASLDGDFNDIVVRVDTDGLATSVVGATVQEDGMSGAAGQAGFPDGSTGNKGPGDTNAQDEASGGAGSLFALFRVGADEDLTIGMASTLPAGLPRLMSKGEEVSYALAGNTVTALAGAGEAQREVFTLTINADGSWAFDLKDQLDHAPGGGENTLLRTADGGTVSGIDLGRLITGTDADGDTVAAAGGAFVIRVQDDIPVALPPAVAWQGTFTFVSEESSFFNTLSIQGAGASSGAIGETPGGATTVSFDPADGAGGDFVLDTGFDSALARVQIFADDGDGIFNPALDQRIGIDKAVSELSWSDLAAASLNGTRDLFLAFDDGGAGVDRDFNDLVVRVEAERIETPIVTATVEEDGMSGAAGVPGPDGSTGNKDAGDTATQDEASGGVGSLYALFSVGADEELSLGLASTLPAGLPRLLSQGEEVSYVLTGNTLTAVAGIGEAQREIFNFTVNADGSWAFDLKDQLDHAAGNGENTLLRTADGGTVGGIDLSAFVTGTDRDGDTVAATGGALVIRVQDDVPAVLPPAEASETTFTFVAEESSFFNTLSIQGSGTSSGSVGEVPGASATVTFDAADGAGGDFVLDTGLDSSLARVEIWADDGDGVFNTALDQRVGSDKAVSELSWNDLAAASVNGTRDLFLAFDDGGASFDRDFNDLVVRVETDRVETAIVAATVEEDGMSGAVGVPGPDGSTGNKDVGDTTVQDEASGLAGSLTALFSVGADEDISIGLASPLPGGLPRLLSQGEVVSYVVTATTVTALAGSGEAQREVFTLSVNADGSWAFDLKDQLDHVAGNGENTLLRTADGGTVSGIDLSAFVTGTDRDGDTVAAQAGGFVIRVQDDVPRFAAADAIVVNNVADASETGAFAFTPGADAPFGGVRFADASGETGLSAGGREVIWQASEDGRQATGYVVIDDNGVIDESELVFEARIVGDGTLGFDLVQPLDEVDPAGASLAFDVVGSDFDGDRAFGTLSVTIANSAPVDGTAAAESVNGTTLADVIDGRDGNDWLYGDDGDDILIGNLGADSAVGGQGADTFKLTDISAQDLIADYGTGVDRIDLTALFSTGTDGPASPSELLEYVRYDAGNLSVDVDGTGDSHGFVQVAVVETAGAGTPPPSIQIVYDDQSHQVQTATLNG